MTRTLARGTSVSDDDVVSDEHSWPRWTSPMAPSTHRHPQSVPGIFVDTTGLDTSGIKDLLSRMAGWTSSQSTTEAPSIRRLRTLSGGLLPALERYRSEPASSQEMALWLHNESGLTWDQLARTLGVSRRSLHAWAAGQRVNGANLERLSTVYRTIRAIGANSPESMRHLLFAPRLAAPSMFDDLVARARKAAPASGGVSVAERMGVAPLI